MKYADGTEVCLGVMETLGLSWRRWTLPGYSTNYPKESWAEMKTGIMVLTDRGALVHFEEVDSHLLSMIGPN
jgi:hypothetical protein